MTTRPELLAMIDQRDELDGKIEAAQTELGFDAKAVKAMRKAVKDAAAAKKTLDAIMGADLGVTAAEVAE